MNDGFSALPQISEWLGADRAFGLKPFLLENVSVAEALAVGGLIWPQFVEYRDGVFLEWAFDAGNVDTWFETVKGDPRLVESVINHVHLWDCINTQGQQEESALLDLANLMKVTWQAAARQRFPDRHFTVEVATEEDDYGPTVYLQSIDRQ